MCGIVGIVSEKATKKDIQESVHLLCRRGPDVQDVQDYDISGKRTVLGHTRLAIIDLNPSANQPMEDSSKSLSIIFNGEVYNYLNLKRELEKKGHIFSTKSDTEVILEGYKAFGQAIVEKLDGMFAFALLDKRKKLITLARDPFGKKPLYYYLDKNTLIFSSELKAIHAYPRLQNKLTIDQDAVTKFLMYGYIPSPRSIYQEVKKLPPSTTLQVDIEKIKIVSFKRYWNLEKTPLQRLSLTEAVSQVDDLIQKAVAKRLVADVPVGTFLSGGIDSSLVTTLASHLHPSIETFSVVYDDKRFDESHYIKLVGDRLNIKYNFFKFQEKEVLPLLEEILDYQDEPMADASLLPTTFVAKQTRKKVTVALSGDGGDELFGGYPKYQAQEIVESRFIKLALLPAPLALKMVSSFPISIEKKQILMKFIQAAKYPFYARHFVWGSGSFTFQELSQLLSDGSHMNLDEIFEESKQYAEGFSQKDSINRLLYLDAKIQLPDWYLVKADRASMSQSLEVRSPLLDKALAEFVFSLPGSYKVTRSQTKILLKKVAEKYLPKEVIYRQKMGFGLPLNRWLVTILKNDIDKALKFLPKEQYDQMYIQKLWLDLLHGKADNGTKIWRLFILSKFLQKYGK